MAKRGLLLLLLLGTPAGAQGPATGEAQPVYPLGRAPPDDQDEALAKQAQNPVADLISVPFQSNTNFGVGPNNAVQEVFNIQPVIPIHLGTFNLITRTIIPLISQPSSNPGETLSTFGLGNINTTLFLSPRGAGAFTWGIGPVFGFPTNTSPVLGVAKWTFGPAVVLVGMTGPWVLGVLVNNVWSWAGGASQNVNAFLLQYFVNYNFPGGWYLTSSPVVTANWLAAPYSNKWTFPVGAGGGKMVRLGVHPLNLNAAAYYNIWRPAGGPTWQLRLTAALLF